MLPCSWPSPSVHMTANRNDLDTPCGYCIALQRGLVPPALHASSSTPASERVGPAGPVEAASHVETSVTQLVQRPSALAHAEAAYSVLLSRPLLLRVIHVGQQYRQGHVQLRCSLP